MLYQQHDVNTAKQQQRDLMIPFPKVTRIEVIDNNGRAYVKYGVIKAEIDLQDYERTLKLFVEYEQEEEISID